ncbi:MAG: hypothetical protein R3E96_03090 [Planctomycetota bacterium]
MFAAATALPVAVQRAENPVELALAVQYELPRPPSAFKKICTPAD